MEPLVFICYSSGDREIASEIATFLAAENINVWFDEWKVSLGDSLTNAVQAGLMCTHFIVLISKNSEVAKFQKREFQSTLARYIEEGRPKIIPIILDNSEPPKLIADIKYWKYQGGTEKDRKQLVASITGNLPAQNFIRAIVKKYREVVIDTTHKGDPLPYRACPKCGNIKLKRSSIVDYAGDEEYFIIECTECGWSEWSQ